MNREQWTKKLARIIADIGAGKTPARVRELYVFGSYARGALECKDLDIIVVHEEPPVDLMEALKRKTRSTARTIFEQLCGPDRRFRGLMCKVLRRPGESIDILLGRDLASILQGMPIQESDLRLVWSVGDSAWQEKLRAIPIDVKAGPAPRQQFISPKYIQSDRSAVEHVTTMLHHEVLVLTRIPVENVTAGPSSLLEPRRVSFQLSRWGRKSQALLPYVFSWLEEKRVKEIAINEPGEIWDVKRQFRVQIGRLHLHWMTNLFECERKLLQQCLVPHFRRDYPKELLVFERGPSWKGRIKVQQ